MIDLAQFDPLIEKIGSVQCNAAIMWATRPKSEDPAEHLLHGILHSLVGKPSLKAPLARAACAAIDKLHAAGVHWPTWQPDACGGGSMAGKPLITRCDVKRKRSPRPDVPYCIFWTGAYWAPCASIAQRRAAGYMQMNMTWPPPLPRAGDYLKNRSGRGRFVYRICEVERYKPPRGKWKHTCRLWCERVLPEDVPRGVLMHTFFWNPRKKRS